MTTAATSARSTIRTCLLAGGVLTVLGFAGQALFQTVLLAYVPIGLEALVSVLIGGLGVLGPAVLAVGVVGLGVQLGLAAYGVRPGVPTDERTP